MMPNPRVGTVTMDVTNAVKGAKGGSVEFRVEKAGIVQAGVGKASFAAEKLVENIKAFADAVNKAKPAGAKGHYINRVSISSTMGPGVKVDMATLAPAAARAVIRALQFGATRRKSRAAERPGLFLRPAGYCSLIPASRMTLPSRSVSEAIILREVVRRGDAARRSPAARRCARCPGRARPWRTPRCSRFTIGAGVPAGATMPCHMSRSRPGKPASAMVGTSGRGVDALLAADGDDAKLAGLRLLADRDVGGEQEIDAAGHDVGRGRRGAAIGHVHHRHADAGLEHLAEDLTAGADALRAEAQARRACSWHAPRARRRSSPGCRPAPPGCAGTR